MRIPAELKNAFLCELYFGTSVPGLKDFTRRAYRDFNRTIHGIARFVEDDPKNDQLKRSLYTEAETLIMARVLDLEILWQRTEGESLDIAFNDWHQSCRTQLISHYNRELTKAGKKRFTHGQAQKWLNMTLKYLLYFGTYEYDWIAKWEPFLHVPVDEVILYAAIEEKIVEERPCKNWSTWDDSSAYESFQRKFNDAALIRSPIAYEALLWTRHRSAALRKKPK